MFGMHLSAFRRADTWSQGQLNLVFITAGEVIHLCSLLAKAGSSHIDARLQIAEWVSEHSSDQVVVDFDCWLGTLQAAKDAELARDKARQRLTDLSQEVAELEESLRKGSVARANDVRHSLADLVWRCGLAPSVQMVVQAVIHATDLETRGCTADLDQLAGFTGMNKVDVHDALMAAHDAGILAYSKDCRTITFVFDITSAGPEKD